MRFKGTKNMKDEMMDRLTEDVGGFNNAGTWDDFTNYYEVVPSNYLETLIWAEADRMGSLNVDDKNFKSERDVVKEEFRSRVLARRMVASSMRSKSTHLPPPISAPGIGSMKNWMRPLG